MLDSIRGWDSTGVVSVNRAGEANTLKKAVDGYSFTDMKSFDKFMTNKALNTELLLGHNRAATLGKVSTANAHPFLDGSTILVHNGTLSTWASLHRSTETNVDSEAICFEVENSGIKETVAKLNGAFTICTYDVNEREFNIIRNEERPMWLAGVKDKDALIFASDPGFIISAANKFNIELTCAPWPLNPKTLLTFDLTSNTQVSKFNVDKEIKFYEPPSYGRRYVSNRKKSVTSTQSNNTTPTDTRNSTALISNKDLKDRRQNDTAARLSTLGLKMGDKIVGQVGAFHSFRGGNTLCTDNTQGKIDLTWCDPNDPESNKELLCYRVTWKEYGLMKDDTVHCEVIGVQDTSPKSTMVSNWCPIVRITKIFTTKDHEEFWNLFSNEPITTEFGSEEDKTVTADGKEVSISEFKTKTSSGCCVCSDPINVEDAEEIIWAMNEPLCKSCTVEFAYRSHQTGHSVAELLTH